MFPSILCLCRVQTDRLADAQMIKKPKDLLRRQSKDKELELGEGKLHAFMANTSITHSSDYSNSFVSFLGHPSTKKLYCGTTENNVAGLPPGGRQWVCLAQNPHWYPPSVWGKTRFEKQGAKSAPSSVQEAEFVSKSPECSKRQICL